MLPETSNRGKALLPLVLKAQGEELALQELSDSRSHGKAISCQELESRRDTDIAGKCNSEEEEAERDTSASLLLTPDSLVALLGLIQPEDCQ